MQIRVLTYNVWGLPDLPFRKLSPHRRDRVQLISEALRTNAQSPTPWDVIFLQEVWLKEDRELFKHSGFPFHADLDLKNSHLDSGLLILSRYPLENEFASRLLFQERGSPFRIFQDGETLVNKGAILTRMRHPKLGTLWLSNTHLIAVYPGRTDFYFKHRQAQIRQWAEWIRRRVKSDEPLVIGGDLNFSHHSPHWNELESLFPEFRPSQDHHLFKTCLAEERQSLGLNGKLDHLFASPPLTPLESHVHFTQPQAHLRGELLLSDHFGWETRFAWASRSPAKREESSLLGLPLKKATSNQRTALT